MRYGELWQTTLLGLNGVMVGPEIAYDGLVASEVMRLPTSGQQNDGYPTSTQLVILYTSAHV